MAAYMSQFSVDDLVDVFCMCEASIVQIENQNSIYADDESILKIIKYLWLPNNFKNLMPTLVVIGLSTSPDYVRFG